VTLSLILVVFTDTLKPLADEVREEEAAKSAPAGFFIA
jgi:hypothetical protein